MARVRLRQTGACTQACPGQHRRQPTLHVAVGALPGRVADALPCGLIARAVEVAVLAIAGLCGEIVAAFGPTPACLAHARAGGGAAVAVSATRHAIARI